MPIVQPCGVTRVAPWQPEELWGEQVQRWVGSRPVHLEAREDDASVSRSDGLLVLCHEVEDLLVVPKFAQDIGLRVSKHLTSGVAFS